jgi:hypothetical protein
MKEVDGEHTGENLSKYIMEVIYEYDIAKILGYFVMDNVDNNDTLMTHLSLAIRRDFNLRYDPQHHRLRCQGHIINLAVKSFLFVTNKEVIKEDDEIDIMRVTLKEIEQWRKKGPLGKLHNFVIWLTQSTQRLQHFLELSNDLHIPRDNTTRWNSWYMMLSACLNLRGAIDDFNQYATADLLKDQLTDIEWDTIQKIKEFLEKLKMATKAYESKHSTLDLVLPSMDYILAQFERFKEANQNDIIMAPMFNLGWAKLDKYYRLSDSTPVYIAAIVLHPSKKWRYIDKYWSRDWLGPTREAIRDFWEKKYRLAPSITFATLSSSSTPRSNKPKNDFLEWL